MIDPITVTVADAKQVLGIGHTTLYRLIGEGKIQTLKMGRKTLVTMASIRQFVATLEAA